MPRHLLRRYLRQEASKGSLSDLLEVGDRFGDFLHEADERRLARAQSREIERKMSKRERLEEVENARQARHPVSTVHNLTLTLTYP